jgi:hypothetical protein
VETRTSRYHALQGPGISSRRVRAARVRRRDRDGESEPMVHLPEPRRFGGASVNDELAHAARRAAHADALDAPGALAALRQAVAAALARGAQQQLLDALRRAPDAASHRALAGAIARAVERADDEAGVVARAFALPLVLVASAQRGAVIPGILGDVASLVALLERTHALGPTRSFGLSNALCAVDALEALAPQTLTALARGLDAQALQALLPPAPVRVRPGHEQTHLRFVLGAGLTAPDAPGITEAAAHIEPWGAECARLLQQQLGAPGLQILVLPRPPHDLLRAAHAGRFAQLEIAWNLFASNAVRRFRLAAGEPVAIVSAHEGGEIRVTLSSPFAEDLTEGFAWPLHPADDLAAVQASICGLLADMRVNDVRIAERVLPSLRASGAPLYPRVDEWDRLRRGALG